MTYRDISHSGPEMVHGEWAGSVPQPARPRVRGLPGRTGGTPQFLDAGSGVAFPTTSKPVA